MLSKFKIATKIYLLGVIQLALMIIMGSLALSQMAKIGVELVDIAKVDIPLANAVTKITEHQLEQAIIFERALFQALLYSQGDTSALQKFNQYKDEVIHLEEIIHKEIKETTEFVKAGINKVYTEKGQKKFKHVLDELQKIDTSYIKLVKEINTTLDLAQSGQIQNMVQQAEQTKAHEDALIHKLEALLEEIQIFTLQASKQAEQDEKNGIKMITILFIVALVIGVFLPFVIARSITRPMNYLVARLNEVASGDGDLTVSLNDNAQDETGDVARAFNQFLQVLRKLISNTNTQADVLGEASETALSIMRETVNNVDKQRTETEMVATAVTQMSSTTEAVMKSSAHAAEVTEKVKTRVSEGQQAAIETQNVIKQLADEVTEAGSVIKNLVEETNNIGSVLESIQGIAEQTNLLALNAAIEAARAGETGRGFAVVADEVRTLAQRTQTSTVDIQGLVERLQSQANNAVTSMRKGSVSANMCLEKSNETSQAFEDASSAVIEISDLNLQIAEAAKEQFSVAETVNQNLVNITGLASITADGAKATSEANTTIAKRVIDLHTNLNVFVI